MVEGIRLLTACSRCFCRLTSYTLAIVHLELHYICMLAMIRPKGDFPINLCVCVCVWECVSGIALVVDLASPNLRLDKPKISTFTLQNGCLLFKFSDY